MPRCFLHNHPYNSFIWLIFHLFSSQIQSKCHLRKVNFSDRVYSEDELPDDFTAVPLYTSGPPQIAILGICCFCLPAKNMVQTEYILFFFVLCLLFGVWCSLESTCEASAKPSPKLGLEMGSF